MFLNIRRKPETVVARQVHFILRVFSYLCCFYLKKSYVQKETAKDKPLYFIGFNFARILGIQLIFFSSWVSFSYVIDGFTLRVHAQFGS